MKKLHEVLANLRRINPTLLSTYYVLATFAAAFLLAVFRIFILPHKAEDFNIQSFATSGACFAFNAVMVILLIVIFCMRYTLQYQVEEPKKKVRRFLRNLPGKSDAAPRLSLRTVRPSLPRPYMPGSMRMFNALLAVMSLLCAVYGFVLASRATNVVFFYYMLAMGSVFNGAYFFYITRVQNRCAPGTLYLALIPVVWNAMRVLDIFIRISTYASAGYHASQLLSSCAVTLFFLYEARMYLPDKVLWKPATHFTFACMSILTIGCDALPRILSVVMYGYAEQQLYFALFDLILLVALVQRLILPRTRHNLQVPNTQFLHENNQEQKQE